jgi:hypothetical protein
LDDAGKHGDCPAAKPTKKKAPLLITVIEALMTKAIKKDMQLLLYPSGWKKQILQIRAGHIVQFIVGLFADFDQAVK